jgi:hypothetical protein
MGDIHTQILRTQNRSSFGVRLRVSRAAEWRSCANVLLMLHVHTLLRREAACGATAVAAAAVVAWWCWRSAVRCSTSSWLSHSPDFVTMVSPAH